MASKLEGNTQQLPPHATTIPHGKKQLTKFEYIRDHEITQLAPPNKYIVIRVDGRRFKGFAEREQWNRPVDDRPYKLMNRVAAEVMKIYDSVIIMATGQSDEMSFIFRQDTDLYHRRLDKIMTTIASTFTAYYIALYPEYVNPAVCPYDVDLHKVGSAFYSTIEPTIHPCACKSSQLLATGMVQEPITINFIQNQDTIGQEQDNVNNNDDDNNGNSHIHEQDSTTTTNTNPTYVWCQRYGYKYAKWCPFNHHNLPSHELATEANISTLQQQQSKKSKKRQLPPLPVFDAKVILLDTLQQIHDYISWRQVDQHINNQYNSLFYTLTNPTTSSHGAIPPHTQHTPEQAEAIINGTVAHEKVILLDVLCKQDYFSLPASYRRNSLLFWSDYLPFTTQFGAAGDETQLILSLVNNTIGYYIQQQYSVETFLEKLSTLHKQTTTTQQQHHQDPDTDLSTIATTPEGTSNNELSTSADLQQLCEQLVLWFYYGQNQNLKFPQTLANTLQTWNANPENNTTSIFNSINISQLISDLADINKDVKMVLMELQTIKKQMDQNNNNSNSHNNVQSIFSKIQDLIPQSIIQHLLPNTSLQHIADNYQDDAQDDETSNNNNNDTPQVDEDDDGFNKQQKANQRRIIVYHGDLIRNTVTDGNNNRNDKKSKQDNKNNQNNTTSKNPFGLPHVDNAFWDTHHGLSPYLSYRQQQLSIKKQFKKMRKAQHVQNNAKIRAQLAQLDPETRLKLENELEQQHQQQATSEKGDTTNDGPDNSKHLDKSQDWGKNKRKFNKYYAHFGADFNVKDVLEQKEKALQDGMGNTTRGKVSSSNTGDNGEDYKKSTTQDFITTQYKLFVKYIQQKQKTIPHGTPTLQQITAQYLLRNRPKL